MEIVFKGQNETRKDFTQQKFEVKNKNEGTYFSLKYNSSFIKLISIFRAAQFIFFSSNFMQLPVKALVSPISITLGGQILGLLLVQSQSFVWWKMYVSWLQRP